MGSGIRSVNLWVAVSDCGPGTSAPGLELVADNRRIIHETGTQGAFFDWTVGHELVAELQQQHLLSVLLSGLVTPYSLIIFACIERVRGPQTPCRVTRSSRGFSPSPQLP